MTKSVQIKRVSANNTPPANNSLQPGELYLEMGSPFRLWAGVPVSINATGRKTLIEATGGGVTSFNTRTGAVALLSGDVTTALGYTPPQINGTGATGTWNIDILGSAGSVTNGVYTTGNQTIGGVKSFTSQLQANNLFISGASGPAGGRTVFAKPASGSTLAGNVVVEVYENSFRVFEAVSGLRGATMDLTACADAAASVILHSTNYTTYAPTKTGTGASGTWGINITGNAATATNATNATTATTATTAGNVSGVVAVANGGTGASTVAAARTSLGIDTDDNVTFGSVADTAGNLRDVPQNVQTAAYTLVLADAGKHISITTGGVVVPSGVFAVGDCVTIYNNSASDQTLTQGASATLRRAASADTGNRTLAQRGLATILCVASNEFVITGAGLT